MSRFLVVCLLLLSSVSLAIADDKAQEARKTIDALEQPLYNPFVERYVLDEIKQLRVDQANHRNEMIQQIVDREHSSVDRAVAYATDTVSYFFYLVAGATSILVIVGWSSIHEARARVQSHADEKISKLIRQYEKRLNDIEGQLKQKTRHIEQNRDEIELTQDIQSLWLRAAQEIGPSGKIAIYDHILQLRNDDCEALTYKADAVLELDEPQWAISLCRQVLGISPNHGHALYQLGCAYTVMGEFDEAVKYLTQALSSDEAYRDDIAQDTALKPLAEYQPFKEMLNSYPS